ncbi:MAG: heat shock protein Hsp20 [Gemmatimonadetes bacterium]|nr:heat shock protein Hsp20 [Gemmatimonadota bacterium]
MAQQRSEELRSQSQQAQQPQQTPQSQQRQSTQSQQQMSNTARDLEQRIPQSSETMPARTGDRSGLLRNGRLASPLDLMRRMSAELDRLVGDPSGGVDWVPQIEVLRRNNAVVVRAELAGINPDEIDVVVDNGMLTISGVRQVQRREEHDGVLQTERSYGRFARTVTLPDGVDEDNITADFRDGVLELSIPVSTRGRGRRIAVQGSSNSQSNSQGG